MTDTITDGRFTLSHFLSVGNAITVMSWQGLTVVLDNGNYYARTVSNDPTTNRYRLNTDNDGRSFYWIEWEDT